jgi:hypothetical protein
LHNTWCFVDVIVSSKVIPPSHVLVTHPWLLFLLKIYSFWVCWSVPVITALGRQRPEDWEFKASLGLHHKTRSLKQKSLFFHTRRGSDSDK